MKTVITYIIEIFGGRKLEKLTGLGILWFLVAEAHAKSVAW